VTWGTAVAHRHKQVGDELLEPERIHFFDKVEQFLFEGRVEHLICGTDQFFWRFALGSGVIILFRGFSVVLGGLFVAGRLSELDELWELHQKIAVDELWLLFRDLLSGFCDYVKPSLWGSSRPARNKS
jgi:hypothetical protein